MLLLTSVNDQLQVVTGSDGAIDVHATWVDTVPSTGAITPGRTNTAIVTAATTSVAGSPAVSTQRNVKTLHIRNKHATQATDVTIRHSDGTAVCELYKRLLGAGGEIEYTDQGGFLNLRI